MRPGAPYQPPPAVRALLLAIQVLDDVDLELAEAGLVLPGGHRVAWRLVAAVARDRAADDPGDRRAFAGWLDTVCRLAARPQDMLADLTRPVGLPRDHAAHPGRRWIQEVVLGDALHLGVGVVGLVELDEVSLVPRTAWAAVGVNPAVYWPRCRRILEEMGALAARRWELSTDGMLRPMGDCDVVTLLGSASLRVGLAGTAGGMRAVGAPMRRRGWTRLSRLDPAFIPAAAMATDPAERGFVRPLLVTADEVVLAAEGGRIDISLADPVGERWDAPVLFR